MRNALRRMMVRLFDAVLKAPPEEWPRSYKVTIHKLEDPTLDDADLINQRIYDVLDEESKKAYWATQLGIDARRRKINGDA
jgi:ribosome maturation factor RimP